MTNTQPFAASRRVLIMGNPYNGHIPTRLNADRFIAGLETAGFEPVVCWDRLDRTACFDASQHYRCLVVVGGDGTVRDVLNTMPRTGRFAQLPFTTLPAGNENLFARHMGVCGNPQRLIDAIEKLDTHSVDLGQANGKLFTLMLTAGFDAEVVHRVAVARTQEQGVNKVTRRTYVPHIAGSLRRYRYPKITLEADGVTYRGSHVLIFNLPLYGGPVVPIPQADGQDGVLDYLVLERGGAVRMLGYFQALFRGSEGRDIHRGRAKSLKLWCDRDVAVQADGDPTGHAPCEICVLPKALKVVRIPPLAASA